MRLNQKPLFAGLFMAGLSISLFASAALGDTPPPVKAVYRAVSFGIDEAANTRKLIELAAEGWEYVGQLGNGMVAFKRPVSAATAAALEKLQGVWVLTSREEAGQGVEYADDTLTMTFTGNRWVFKSGDEVRQAGTFTVDAGKDPKHFDFTVTEGGNLGRTGYAIFQFDGKRFRYCANDSGADARPTDFTTKEGLPVLTRCLNR